MENWERKFDVDPEGNAEEVKLSEEEKLKKFVSMHPKKKSLFRLNDEKGNIEVVKDKDSKKK